MRMRGDGTLASAEDHGSLTGKVAVYGARKASARDRQAIARRGRGGSPPTRQPPPPPPRGSGARWWRRSSRRRSDRRQGDVSKAPTSSGVCRRTIRALAGWTCGEQRRRLPFFQPLEEVTEAEFHASSHQRAGPLRSTTRQARDKALPGRRERHHVSSVASTAPVPNSAIYSSTKGAVDTLRRPLALEARSAGIPVNAVNPGLHRDGGVIDMGDVIGTDSIDSSSRHAARRSGKRQDIAPAGEYSPRRGRMGHGETLRWRAGCV